MIFLNLRARRLIPCIRLMILRGWDPIFGGLIITLIITALIMFLVGGLSRRALTGFLGASGGVCLTAVLAFAFTGWFKIHGAVRPFTESLLFSGYGHLNLAHLFIAGIFIAVSGAMTDLAMDVAAAMDEIKTQQPAPQIKTEGRGRPKTPRETLSVYVDSRF